MEPIRIIRVGNGLAFPDFEDGVRLTDLIDAIAGALRSPALQPIGSPLEWLIPFQGLPDDVRLWWDGFACELGTTSSPPVMNDILHRLLASEQFKLAN